MKNELNQNLKELVNRFQKQRILVIGDFMLDEYIFGRVERISPEAPVPVVEEKNRNWVPGGAGNVVSNLRSLNAQVIACGVIGTDLEAIKLKEKLYSLGLEKENLQLIELNDRPTTRKTRILAGNQQICRLDLENHNPIDNKIRSQILKNIESIISSVSAVVLSDYDKGVIGPDLINEVVKLSNQHKIPVTVDPQITHFGAYQNVFILTPNHHEVGRFLGRKLSSDQEIEQAGVELLERLHCNHVLITRGEKGMTLISPNRVKHVPTVAREVFDVTGAGDTVISVLTLALASNMDLDYSVELSNFGAGIVVGRIGAATLMPQDLANFQFKG